MNKYLILTVSILFICFAFILLIEIKVPSEKVTISDMQKNIVVPNNGVENVQNAVPNVSKENPVPILQISKEHIANTTLDNGFIEKASSYLQAQGIPTINRERSIQYTNGLAVVKFSPMRVEGKPLPRAGSYIVTLDEQSSEVLDAKVWR